MDTYELSLPENSMLKYALPLSKMKHRMMIIIFRSAEM